jgi:hypothetical protein
VLNRAFGSLILHEITAHRIEQFKRERLAGKWRGHGYKSTAKPIQPATVNREMDTLRSVFSRAVEWGQLLEHPMRRVKRLEVDNRHPDSDGGRAGPADCHRPKKLGDAIPKGTSLFVFTNARTHNCYSVNGVAGR